MDRNILLSGSISAIIILILASFSNVVSYNLFDSHSLNESPLFSVRKQSALQQDTENKIMSEYLGKGKNSTVLISERNNTFEKIQEIINRIKLMDDNTFKIFVHAMICQLSQQEKNTDFEPDKIIYELYRWRSTSKIIERKEVYSDGDRTWLATPTICWFPGCILIETIAFILLFIILSIIFPPTTPMSCNVCPGLYK